MRVQIEHDRPGDSPSPSASNSAQRLQIQNLPQAVEVRSRTPSPVPYRLLSPPPPQSVQPIQPSKVPVLQFADLPAPSTLLEHLDETFFKPISNDFDSGSDSDEESLDLTSLQPTPKSSPGPTLMPAVPVVQPQASFRRSTPHLPSPEPVIPTSTSSPPLLPALDPSRTTESPTLPSPLSPPPTVPIGYPPLPPSILYSDDLMTVSSLHLTIHSFYFPLNTPLTIPLLSITNLETHAPSAENGSSAAGAWSKYKSWGRVALSDIWWARDPKPGDPQESQDNRSSRGSTGDSAKEPVMYIVVRVEGEWLRKGFGIQSEPGVTILKEAWATVRESRLGHCTLRPTDGLAVASSSVRADAAEIAVHVEAEAAVSGVWSHLLS
ncbi:hypothetical protein BGW38_000378 [Lunasporangiospora selenospora]|uniref:Uncharacterized protein n=1 Tax=Lunasporangiospora selenospora TaxID=979761 RepID=A0A9P6KJA2_9FUNG|nr:hypothetical protein BGW38_000378 [Lunasporangiospora selenospora]